MINFNANISFAKSANQPKILDAEGFLKFRQDYNEGRNSDEYLAKYPQIFVNPFKLQGVDPLVGIIMTKVYLPHLSLINNWKLNGYPV